MAANLTSGTFDDEIMNSGTPVLVDFYADWCMPCKLIAPIIDEIADEAENLKVFSVNVDEETDLAVRFQIESIPTLIVFKDGKIAKQLLGVRPKSEILEMLNV